MVINSLSDMILSLYVPFVQNTEQSTTSTCTCGYIFTTYKRTLRPDLSRTLRGHLERLRLEHLERAFLTPL